MMQFGSWIFGLFDIDQGRVLRSSASGRYIDSGTLKRASAQVSDRNVFGHRIGGIFAADLYRTRFIPVIEISGR